MRALVKILVCIVFLPIFSQAREFPDAAGVLDFSKPEEIANRVFILTNPKSGSHLLLYSIMKITKRPLRGRLPLWIFENDPPYFHTENMMQYPLDFSKPTTYWGHEYYLLGFLNHRENKLIFIIRNYKENICSQLVLKYREQSKNIDLEKALLNEVTGEGMIFKEYMIRLQLFDHWHPQDRCLVSFEDLLHHPEVFVPQVMSFIGDDSDYTDFIAHYDDFKAELMERYSKKDKRTGAGSDEKFFSVKISPEILREVDHYVCQHYPDLWVKYLERYSESRIDKAD